MKDWLRSYTDEFLTTRGLVMLAASMTSALSFALIQGPKLLEFKRLAGGSTKPTVPFLLHQYLNGGLFALTFFSITVVLAASIVQSHGNPEMLLRHPNSTQWFASMLWKTFTPRLLALLTLALTCFALAQLLFMSQVNSFDPNLGDLLITQIDEPASFGLDAWQAVLAMLAYVLVAPLVAVLVLANGFLRDFSVRRLQWMAAGLMVFMPSSSTILYDQLGGLNILKAPGLDLSDLGSHQRYGSWWVALVLWVAIALALFLNLRRNDLLLTVPKQARILSVRARWAFLVAAVILVEVMRQMTVNRMPTPVDFNWRFSAMFAGDQFGVYSALLSLPVVIITALFCRNLALPRLLVVGAVWSTLVLLLCIAVFDLCGGSIDGGLFGLPSAQRAVIYLAGFWLALAVHWYFFALLSRLLFDRIGANKAGVLLVLATTLSWLLAPTWMNGNPFLLSLAPVAETDWPTLLLKLAPTLVVAVALAVYVVRSKTPRTTAIN